jgi:hypothetical protein
MAYPVKFFHSAMSGAPVLSNNWGDLIGLLDGCLVTGFNLKTINGITANAGVATASISGGHTYVKDQIVLISGCDQPAYNGERRVTGITANTFTFDVAGNPASPATTQGSISCKVAPLGWEKAFSGTNKAAYRSTDPASPRHYLRVDDDIKQANGFNSYDTSWAKWANVGICENMTDIDTIVGAQAPFDPNNPTQNWKQKENWHFGWHKWYHGHQSGIENTGDGGAGPRNWVLVGDGRLFFLMNTMQQGFTWYGRCVYAFGDPISFKPGDNSATILKAHDRYWTNNQHWSYPSQFGGSNMLALELDWEGAVMLRNFIQLGNPIRWGLCTLNTTNLQKGCGRGGLPFPNGPDYALWLLPAYIRQEDGHMRGIMPGMRWIPQDRPYSDMTVVDNVVDEEGKSFLLPRYSYSSEPEWGQLAFDITGPWR